MAATTRIGAGRCRRKAHLGPASARRQAGRTRVLQTGKPGLGVGGHARMTGRTSAHVFPLIVAAGPARTAAARADRTRDRGAPVRKIGTRAGSAGGAWQAAEFERQNGKGERPPGLPAGVSFDSSGDGTDGLEWITVAQLGLGGGHGADGAVQALGVVPVDPVHGLPRDVLEVFP